MQITREMFDRSIKLPHVLELIDDLEIQIADRTELFDVLDADGSGVIDISEMISGLMKMRSGGADKSDMVAAVLGIRAIQTSVRDYSEEVLMNQRLMFQLIPGGQAAVDARKALAEAAVGSERPRTGVLRCSAKQTCFEEVDSVIDSTY